MGWLLWGTAPVGYAISQPGQALHDACAKGDAREVGRLLEAGADPNLPISGRACCYSVNEWPINTATTQGDVGIVRMLLDHGAKIDKPDSEGLKPIHLAAQSGNLEMVKLLLSRGAGIHSPSGYSKSTETPLESACISGDLAMVKYLVAQGASPAKSADCLSCAARSQKQEVVLFLLEHGARISASGESPVVAATDKGDLAMVKLLVKHGAALNAKEKDGWSSIHTASRSGNAELVAYLLDHGANANLPIQSKQTDYSQNGYRPLHFAANGAVTKLLLDHGAEVNRQAKDGKTPLHLAKDPESVQLLLDHGARVDLRDGAKQQPLHSLASEYGTKPESIRALLRHGASLDTTDYDDKTALDEAAFWGRTEAAQTLIECGARPTAVTMEAAIRSKSLPIVLLLVSHGVEVPADARAQWPELAKKLTPLKRSRPEK
ncbi:MAG: ankyrin repeat domain-containing protein [Luteolibacter sp.]